VDTTSDQRSWDKWGPGLSPDDGHAGNLRHGVHPGNQTAMAALAYVPKYELARARTPPEPAASFFDPLRRRAAKNVVDQSSDGTANLSFPGSRPKKPLGALQLRSSNANTVFAVERRSYPRPYYGKTPFPSEHPSKFDQVTAVPARHRPHKKKNRSTAVPRLLSFRGAALI